MILQNNYAKTKTLPLVSSTGVVYGSIEYSPDTEQGKEIERALNAPAAIKDTAAKLKPE